MMTHKKSFPIFREKLFQSRIKTSNPKEFKDFSVASPLEKIEDEGKGNQFQEDFQKLFQRGKKRKRSKGKKKRLGMVRSKAVFRNERWSKFNYEKATQESSSVSAFPNRGKIQKFDFS